jgi:hypothetical protein
METTNLIFKDFKFRCHHLGTLMTNLPGLSKAENEKFETLSQRKKEAKLGKAKELTPLMEENLKELIIKKYREDSLPTGAKSYLDEIFDEVYWRRKRLLSNKYIDKGLMNEQDVLELHSNIDGVTYWKNTIPFENEFIKGMPDTIFEETMTVKDAKANYDLESFRKADLNSTYLWQLKGYMWLTGLKKAELMYGLVNNPLHQIHNAITSAFYALGCPDDDNEIFIQTKMQIERNMIFDHRLFIEEYPNYTFHNPVLDFDIPEILRVKKFDVTLDDADIINMQTRVTLSRIYLTQKEIETRKLDGTLVNK